MKEKTKKEKIIGALNNTARVLWNIVLVFLIFGLFIPGIVDAESRQIEILCIAGTVLCVLCWVLYMELKNTKTDEKTFKLLCEYSNFDSKTHIAICEQLKSIIEVMRMQNERIHDMEKDLCMPMMMELDEKLNEGCADIDDNADNTETDGTEH